MFKVEYVFYLLIIIGAVLAAMSSIEHLVRQYRSKRHFRNLKKAALEGEELKGVINKHLGMLLKTTFNIKNRNAPFYFASGSLALALLVMVVINRVMPFKMTLLIGTVIMVTPYVSLRMILEQKRYKGSHEGDILIAELLNQYKLNYYNMSEAIEKTAYYLDDAPTSQHLLIKIAREIKVCKNDKELREVLDEFDYNYRTNWSNILANNIYYSIAGGTVVTDALRDLMQSIAKARKIIEHGRRENSEATSMLKYLAPGCYILTVFAATKYFDFSLEKFFSYQFYTESGLSFFTYFIISYIASIALAIFFQRKKMDL